MPKKKEAKKRPDQTEKARGRKFRPDGLGRGMKDKKQPEWKHFDSLEAGTTLLEFLVDSGLEANAGQAAGAIRAGRYTIGGAERMTEGTWRLDRPIECARITDPDFVLKPPCVVRGGWKSLKAAIIKG